MSPPLVALEEHFYSEAIFNSLDVGFQRVLKAAPQLADQLRDVGPERLANMNRGNIALQVVSHAFTPGKRAGGPSALNCTAGNDELAAAIKNNAQPERFAAFAVLPVADAPASAQELERAVTSLGFVGALIDNQANGKHFDSPAYDILWEKACALDVPIYLHPTWPSADMAKNFMGEYAPHVAISLGGPGWGWHGDVGLHVLKLFCAGVFDRFPKLKIILGHMGELLPYMLERCFEMSTQFAGGWGQRHRDLRTVWDENIWITTSGLCSLAPLKCVLDNTKVERIMYSVDYPFDSTEKGRKWFEQLEASGLLSAGELAMVAHQNAESLLKLRVQSSA